MTACAMLARCLSSPATDYAAVFVAGCAVLSMDMYNDGSRVIDSNFDGAYT